MNNRTCVSLEASLKRLECWIERNGWAGYDPYDLRGTRFARALVQLPRGSQLVRGVEQFAPYVARRLLRVRPQVNAKAIGLLALGYLTRFQTTGQGMYRQRAKACLEWLEANIRTGYAGACWGYPFNWFTRVEIPAGTPSSVVSSVGGWAFLEAYRLLAEPRYLDVARSVADFFLCDLNLDRLDEHHACFSYTPIDHFHVHNANLFVAAHLYELAVLTGDTVYSEAAEPAVTYSLRGQNADGSWYYWGLPDDLRHSIDHYHTGFVLRCLDRLCRASRRVNWQEALKRGWHFYAHQLLDPSGLPRMTPNRAHPVDVHSCSEAILCLTQLRQRYPEARGYLPAVVAWTLREMQAPDGHFYYRKYPRHTSRIAFMRWGQAWMFWALAAYANAVGNDLV